MRGRTWGGRRVGFLAYASRAVCSSSGGLSDESARQGRMGFMWYVLGMRERFLFACRHGRAIDTLSPKKSRPHPTVIPTQR